MRKIFGHRGLPQTYVENTITSLNKALEICDFIETDVRITRDEQLVLYHDSTIENKKIDFKNYLEREFKASKNYKSELKWFEGAWSRFKPGLGKDKRGVSGVKRDELIYIGKRITKI